MKLALVAIAAAAALLTGCGEDSATPATSTDSAGSRTALEDAARFCLNDNQNLRVIGDDGHTLDLDGVPDGAKPEVSELDTDDIACVLGAVETPDSVLAQMESTTSLQGRQVAEWDGVTASWTYHPDNGFDVILTDGESP